MALKKLAVTAVFGVAALGGVLVAPTADAATGNSNTSAAAAPAAATTCYGSAKSFSTDGALQWPAGSAWAHTTSNCGDINVKPKSGMWVQTCFYSTNSCNKATWITGGTWGTAATDVRDGTTFYLQFDRTTSGLVAY
ncbi:hypothetical protein ABZ357_10030 [Streptomyces sp. NPDC005917]|uniref:hypothetical protein n=1 Tax=unclassified Streptomyces TaxID=2593676 RepID=UPI0034017688